MDSASSGSFCRSASSLVTSQDRGRLETNGPKYYPEGTELLELVLDRERKQRAVTACRALADTVPGWGTGGEMCIPPYQQDQRVVSRKNHEHLQCNTVPQGAGHSRLPFQSNSL